MEAIVCRDLVKTFPGKPPVEAVRGLDLTVGRGECFGILGPNGAGKTTTLEILEGLQDPTSGEVLVLGKRWETEGAEIRQRIGITLQETRLSEKQTVSETLALFRSFYRRGLTLDASIAIVGLESKRGSRINTLSGGQKQRVALACALVGDPDILFLDEPSTGLDPQSRQQVWEVVRALKLRGKTILLTTHYMDEAEKLCDRLAVVDHGRVIAQGTPAELIREWGGGNLIELETKGQGPEREAILGIAGVGGVKAIPDELGPDGTTHLILRVDRAHEVIPPLMSLVEKSGAGLSSLNVRQATLEDVFLALTGRNLRDEPA
ncbi:MAG: ABC transporter ATP-binding protein [Gemmataceae bacterium]